MIVFGIMGYLVMALISGILLRLSRETVFTGDDFTTYSFCGFVSLAWPIYIPLLAVGFLASFITDKIKTKEK